MEINARVSTGHGLDFDCQLEVAEIGAVNGSGVDLGGPRAMRDDLAINDFERALMLAGLPSADGFAIEKREPIGGVLRPGEGGSGGGEQHGEDFAARKFWHWVSGRAAL